MPRHIKEVVVDPKAPKPIGPYSHAIKAGPFVFASGQAGLNPATGNLVEGGIEAQTRQVLANLAGVLDAAGSGLDLAVKTTVFMTDLGEFARMNAGYGGYFKTNPPARTTVQVSALPKGAVVEIDVVALLRE